MSKNIGKNVTTSQSSAPGKTKASGSKESKTLISKKVLLTKAPINSTENPIKTVIKSRVPLTATKSMAPLVSTNLKKIKSNTVAIKNISSPRTKTVPMKATMPLAQTKSSVTINNTTKSSKISATPVKAKNTVTAQSAKSHSIMTPIYNVTVSSPPQQRKEIINEPMLEKHANEDPVSPRIRERTLTRTLEPHEVVLLQKTLAQTINNHVAGSPPAPDSLDTEIEVIEPIKVKTPVSFEIKFDESKKPTANKTNPMEEPTKTPNESESEDYEDDFESYESDFESERSTSETNESESDSSASNSNAYEESDDNSATYTKSSTSLDNTYKVNLDDRKLDSGNYDMDMRAESISIVDLKPKPQEPLDCVFEENDENYTNDSGLGYFEALRSPNSTLLPTKTQQVTTTKSKATPQNTRGYELMQKIHLDEMQFTLFELKPMSYEYYMKIYGNYNSGQNSTQTNDDRMHQEIQTDIKFVKTIWTQNPPCLTKPSLENCLSKSYYYDKIGVGYDIDCDDENQVNIRIPPATEMSIEKYNRLNDVLQKAFVTVSDIIYLKSKKHLHQTPLAVSNGYRSVRSSTITKIFSSNSFVITIQNETDRSLIFIWNLFSLETPYRVLCSWSTVECLILLNECIVICGLTNGSISLWDLREPFYWHPEILNNSNVRIATQIVLPELNHDLHQEINDFGKLTDLKLMDNEEQVDLFSSYNATQICALHEYGLVTIWTLIEHKHTTFDTNVSIPNTINSLNNISPWGRINLLQNSVLNLYQYFLTTEHNSKLSRNKTTFHKTIEYFDNNIFNDKILQELNQTNDDTSSKTCATKNVNYNKIEFVAKYGYFVNVSKNYLLFVKKSLKLADIRKIFIDTNILIKCVNFQMASQNKLLITFLSDGSCKIFSILNYLNQFYQSSETYTQTNNDQPSGSGTSVFKANMPNNDLLVASKSCTIQNMIKDERQIYSNEQALNHYDIPEIQILNKTGNNTSNPVHHITSIKTIKLFRNNDLKFLIINNTRSKDKLTLINFYLFKFNENLILNQFDNSLYLYNIETSTQSVLVKAVKNFNVVENVNNRNYLILLVHSSDSTDDIIQIHELNDKLLNF